MERPREAMSEGVARPRAGDSRTEGRERAQENGCNEPETAHARILQPGADAL